MESISSLVDSLFWCGVGLLAGQSFLLGTVTFNSITGNPGTFTASVLVAPATSDGILNGSGIDISAISTFNNATAVVPEPGTISLLGMGLGGLYIVGRRSGRKH